MMCPQQGAEVVWVLVACELVQFPMQPTPVAVAVAVAVAAAAAVVVTALQHHIQLQIPAIEAICIAFLASLRTRTSQACKSALKTFLIKKKMGMKLGNDKYSDRFWISI
jgi:hypothetical protein